MGGHNLRRGVGLILALLSESREPRRGGGGDLLLFTCYTTALNFLSYAHAICITQKS